MTTSTPTAAPTLHTHGGGHLLIHYLEMVAAMFAGMLVCGTLRDLGGLTVPFAEQPGLSFLLMATDMTVGMGLWMLVRGHDRASTLQMCAAMYLPAVLLPMLRAGVLGPMAFMIVAHVVMMTSMLAVLVWHRDRLDPTAEQVCRS